MIRFDHVSYAYTADKSHPVIDDLSLIINKGEELAVMGGNGCGKTTLGFLLCGVLKPDTGTITIDGENRDGAETKPVIGFLFQDPDNGLVATTVEREIAFSLENRNMPPGEMQVIVDRIVGMFDMDRYRERLVWNLSGGEKQRLSLAGLFASGPRILFLDEPASYLDYPGALRLDDALRQVKQADPDLTIIRITQFPHVADSHRRVIIMDEGKILRDEAPEIVFADQNLVRQSRIRPPYKYLTPRPNIEAEKIKNQPGRPHPTAVVELTDISFSYDQEPLLFDGLSLTINRGEVFGLVGPSGCGKSTLAQLICGIYQPISGRVDFHDGGRAVMSFQQPERQFFLDTCFNEVAYGIRGKFKSDTLIEETVRKCFEIVGLDYHKFKDRDPYSLSGGEARRLGFAIVVALDAGIIIFDEPTCGLDEVGLQAFRNMLTSLTASGKTVIIISHNSEIIADLTDRVGLLAEGKIVDIREPLSFYMSDAYKGILSVPEIIDYQRVEYGQIVTTHPAAIFDLDPFYA